MLTILIIVPLIPHQTVSFLKETGHVIHEMTTPLIKKIRHFSRSRTALLFEVEQVVHHYVRYQPI